ncbi:hypothetical protein BHU62_12200 [Serratia marcescens]|uniref:Phosphodiester glycosidase domain-containing protein n=1 Tax=Serratia marcescens TaxID=615 RepID=A0A1Q4NZP3_SERMA|nr:glycoside hydrolase family 75 protein [Serratia marcescens]OKB66317.1 hypothetical protein BHU62_12200 [Serratia marcescens]
MKKCICFLLSYIFLTHYSFAECKFADWFEYEQNYKENKVAHSKVYGIKKHEIPGLAYVFRVNTLGINADGAPNAYSYEDHQALQGKCPSKEKYHYRGLDCPANAGYKIKGMKWQNVLVVDKSTGDAFVRQSGEYKGFLVAKTRLQDPKIVDETDKNKWVNSDVVPYWTFPGQTSFSLKEGTGRVGDIGYVINKKTGKSSAFIIADVGGSATAFGEVSLQLARNLGAKNPDPIRGGDIDGDYYFVIFPKTGMTPLWPVSNLTIEKIAEERLSKVGGINAITSCQGFKFISK